jgi:hypothetical protein
MGRTAEQKRRERAEAGVRLATAELTRIVELLGQAAKATEDRFPRAILAKNVERSNEVRLELLGVVGILQAAAIRGPERESA